MDPKCDADTKNTRWIKNQKIQLEHDPTERNQAKPRQSQRQTKAGPGKEHVVQTA